MSLLVLLYLIGFYNNKKEVIEVKKEKIIVKKCIILETVSNTLGGLYDSTTIKGKTSCDSVNLVYRFYCDYTLISTELGKSYNGIFSKNFLKDHCRDPVVEVEIY